MLHTEQIFMEATSLLFYKLLLKLRKYSMEQTKVNSKLSNTIRKMQQGSKISKTHVLLQYLFLNKLMQWQCMKWTYFRVSFLIKLQFETCNFIKKETLLQVFSCEFCEVSKNTFFIKHLWWLFLNFGILSW